MKSRSLSANSGSRSFFPANRCGYSNVHFSRNQATGFKSTAVTSQPRRIASSGIAPPPANGSRTRGARPPYAARISSRSACNSAALSRSRPQCNTPPTVSPTRRVSRAPPRAPLFARSTWTSLPPIRSQSAFLASGVPGSGRSVAISAARQAASGRRAGQMCSVEMWPCRTFFS